MVLDIVLEESLTFFAGVGLADCSRYLLGFFVFKFNDELPLGEDSLGHVYGLYVGDLRNTRSCVKSIGIEIQEFVAESEIPSLYFEKPYYLEPDKGAGKAYALLREALVKSGKVGIAQFVMRNRESLCVLKPQGPGLILNALRFASEIRSMEELSLPSQEKLSPSDPAESADVRLEGKSKFAPKLPLSSWARTL
jgi:hypothetical protein